MMGTIEDNKNDDKMKFNIIMSQRRRRQRIKRKIAMPFFVVLITVVLITLSWSDNIHRSCGRGDHGGRKCNRQKTVLIVVSSFGPLIPKAIVALIGYFFHRRHRHLYLYGKQGHYG